MVKIVNAIEKQLNQNSKKDIYSEKTYRRPKDTWKDAQHCLLLGKCKSKLQWDITSHWSESPSSKSLQKINAGEGVEKGNTLALLVGMWTDTATMENGMVIPLKTRNKTTIWPGNPIPGHIPWGSQNWKKTHVPSMFIEALFKLARTWKQPRCPLTDEWIKKLWYIYIKWSIIQP